MILHSGNHEIIGIRHRETQTLYISHVIEPHSCSNPAYGKIQVGIYIAAIQETIDRARQAIEAKEKSAGDPPADISPKNGEANPDADSDDYSRERPSRSNKLNRGSGSKGKRQDRHKGKAKRHATGKEIDDKVRIVCLGQVIVVHEKSQVLLANAVKLLLIFVYDIYDSPHPAAFRRMSDEPKEALGPAEPAAPPLSPGRESTPPSSPSIRITVHSELEPGSTGVVHIGKMALDRSGLTGEVAVKLAFSRDEKSRLMEEYRTYSHLHSRHVQGIPYVIGLFVDEDLLLGAEGPYALVTSYAGVSLSRSKDASDSLKQVLNSIDSNLIGRNSLVATLRSIGTTEAVPGFTSTASAAYKPGAFASI